MRRFSILVLAVAVMALVLSGLPSGALVGNTVTTVAFTYLPSNPTISVGQGLNLENFDLDNHTITSNALNPEGTDFLFNSGQVATLGTSGVAGVSILAPGNYAFYCLNHPTLMTGTLTIV